MKSTESTVPHSSAVTAKLIELAYRYYPRIDLTRFDTPMAYEAYREAAPETRARRAMQQAALSDMEAWLEVVDALKAAFPDHDVGELTYPYQDACYVARIEFFLESPEPTLQNRYKALTVCVSMLAPLYLLYESHQRRVGPPGVGPKTRYEVPEILYELTGEAAAIAEVVEREVKARFPGYQRVDAETIAVPVPGISVGNRLVGEATLGDALFTDHRW